MKNEDYHGQMPDAWEPESDAQSPLTTMPVNSLTDAFILADKDYIASRILQAVEAGESDPLKVLAGLKAMEILVNVLTDKSPKTNKHAAKAVAFNECVLNKAGYQSEKKFSLFGATFTKTEGGTKYDYSQCNDYTLRLLEKAAKDATDALKKRQEFLKMVPVEGVPVIDLETGETYTVYPPAKSSTSTLSVSFK
jgi:hypothetical protein